MTEASGYLALCTHPLVVDGLFEIPDTMNDSRCANIAQLSESSQLRFFAGAPLYLKDGARICTLCLVDLKPW